MIAEALPSLRAILLSLVSTIATFCGRLHLSGLTSIRLYDPIAHAPLTLAKWLRDRRLCGEHQWKVRPTLRLLGPITLTNYLGQ